MSQTAVLNWEYKAFAVPIEGHELPLLVASVDFWNIKPYMEGVGHIVTGRIEWLGQFDPNLHRTPAEIIHRQAVQSPAKPVEEESSAQQEGLETAKTT